MRRSTTRCLVLLAVLCVGVGNPALPEPARAADPALSWSTFLGGARQDFAGAVAADADGNIYVAGSSSASWGAPVRPFAGGGTYGSNAFVAKLDANGNLVWNTFVGGGFDYATAIVLGTSGSIYVAGYGSPSWGRPIRPHGSHMDAFVAKLDGNGTLLWNTFLGDTGGGDWWDWATGIAVDADEDVFVSGTSQQAWGNPKRAFTPGMTYYGVPSSDVFVAKLGTDGALLWNTFLGGNLDEGAGRIAVRGREAWVTGSSQSSWGSPVSPLTSSWDPDWGPASDLFLARLEQDGTLVWNTFLGGSEFNEGTAVAVGGDLSCFVAGNTWFAGWGGWGFIARFTPSGEFSWGRYPSGEPSLDATGIALDAQGNAFLTGASRATWETPLRPFTPGIDGLGQATGEGFVAKYTGEGDLLWNLFLGGTANDEAADIAPTAEGGAIVVGRSGAPWGTPIRPFTPGPDQGGNLPLTDAFVARIPPITTVSIAATTAVASEIGPSAGIFTVTREGSTDADLTVAYDLGGTAAAGGDFSVSPGPVGIVTIPAGSTSATITITPIDDSDMELIETVTATLLDGSGYLLLWPVSASVTIASDELVLFVNLVAQRQELPERGESVTIVATRDAASPDPVVVNYTIGGTATPGRDYRASPLPSGSVVIPPDATTATLAVLSPVDDALAEPGETITVSVSDGPGCFPGPQGSTTVTIPLSDPIPLPRALDIRQRWGTFGDGIWFGQRTVTRDHAAAARPDTLGHGQVSWLVTTVTGPAAVSFWWRTSSEVRDRLRVYVDDALKASRGGITPWERRTITVPAGSHDIWWEFSRDDDGSAGLNTAFVDQVTIRR